MLIFACGQPDKNKKEEPQQPYLPVTAYILSEIKALDSQAVGILKRTTSGQRTDSAFIPLEQFRQLAANFLSKELDSASFHENFTEDSFYDQATDYMTFAYRCKKPSSALQRVDVLISPGLSFDKVRNIYMEKAYMSGDTAITQRMTWKPGTSFSIITSRSVAAQKPQVEQVKVTWDPAAY